MIIYAIAGLSFGKMSNGLLVISRHSVDDHSN